MSRPRLIAGDLELGAELRCVWDGADAPDARFGIVGYRDQVRVRTVEGRAAGPLHVAGNELLSGEGVHHVGCVGVAADGEPPRPAVVGGSLEHEAGTAGGPLWEDRLDRATRRDLVRDGAHPRRVGPDVGRVGVAGRWLRCGDGRPSIDRSAIELTVRCLAQTDECLMPGSGYALVAAEDDLASWIVRITARSVSGWYS